MWNSCTYQIQPIVYIFYLFLLILDDPNLKNVCSVLTKNIDNINQDVEKKMDDLFYNVKILTIIYKRW